MYVDCFDYILNGNNYIVAADFKEFKQGQVCYIYQESKYRYVYYLNGTQIITKKEIRRASMFDECQFKISKGQSKKQFCLNPENFNLLFIKEDQPIQLTITEPKTTKNFWAKLIARFSKASNPTCFKFTYISNQFAFYMNCIQHYLTFMGGAYASNFYFSIQQIYEVSQNISTLHSKEFKQEIIQKLEELASKIYQFLLDENIPQLIQNATHLEENQALRHEIEKKSEMLATLTALNNFYDALNVPQKKINNY